MSAIFFASILQLTSVSMNLFSILLSTVLWCEFVTIPSNLCIIDEVYGWIRQYGVNKGQTILTNNRKLSSGISLGWYNRRPFIAYLSENSSEGDKNKGEKKYNVFLILWCSPTWYVNLKYDNYGVRESLDSIPDIDTYALKVIRTKTQWVGEPLKIRTVKIAKTAYDAQVKAADKIIETAKKRKDRYKPPGCVAIVHGPPGQGKSGIGKVLAMKLNATYCPDFNPTKPGHWWDNVRDTVEPTSENPLVVMIEEVDTIIHMFRDGNGKITNDNKWLNMQVSGKSDWSQLLDDVHDYSNTYFIMTMNTQFNVFQDGQSIDPSLLRYGRPDLYISYGHPNNEKHDLMYDDSKYAEAHIEEIDYHMVYHDVKKDGLKLLELNPKDEIVIPIDMDKESKMKDV